MAVPASPRLNLGLSLALLAAFLIASIHLQQDSLWLDEGFSAAIVRDNGAPESLRAVPGFLLGSLRDTLSRSHTDVHPPLYFLLLDAWNWIAGESVYALRLLSAFFCLIGLAATYALGRRLFGWRVGLAALLILATPSMFVYYSREARMYMLLLALAALAMLAYLRWLDRPTLWRTILYGGVLAALLYTHYAGALIVLTQALHLLLSRPRHLLRWLIPAGLALLLFALWIPILLDQWESFGRPGAPPFNDAGVALAALIYALTGGYGLLYLVPLLGLPLAMRRHGQAILLLGLWLLLTPLALWLGNSFVTSLFQPRYTLAILPAAALLVAAGLWALTLTLNPSAAASGRGTFKTSFRPFALTRTRKVPGNEGKQNHLTARNNILNLRLGNIIFVGLLVTILYTQLTLYPTIWSPKPHWDDAVRQVAAIRQPLEPALTSIPVYSPAAYYERRYPIRQGLALDLGWRWQEVADMAGYVAALDGAESIWLMMSSNTVSTWDAARNLLPTYHVGYRDSVIDMLFYRFDAGPGDALRFQFGDVLAYDDGIGHELVAVPGEDFCYTLDLDILAESEHLHRLEFALTQGYDTIRAQWSRDLTLSATDETPHLAPCVPVPAGTPSGPHHLRLRITDQTTGQALPLLENESVYWGETLVFALVHVGA